MLWQWTGGDEGSQWRPFAPPCIWMMCDIKKQVQHRATKLVNGMSDLSYNKRLIRVGIPSLQYRRIRSDMIQVFKILHGLEDTNPDFYFQRSNITQTRGHQWKLIKPRGKTTRHISTFCYRIINSWNSLSDPVVSASSLNIFKSRLNNFWKNHPLKFSPDCF